MNGDWRFVDNAVWRPLGLDPQTGLVTIARTAPEPVLLPEGDRTLLIELDEWEASEVWRG